MHEVISQPAPTQAPRTHPLVEPGSDEDRIIKEELALLANVQKQLANRQIEDLSRSEFDQDLIELRDQIAEANIEDVAPLVAEMYRLQALGARSGNGRSLPVDVSCPYFGHLELVEGKKTREVLIGNRGFVQAGGRFAIVDWRNAPVSRIYYRYDEGDDFEENFGGRSTSGLVTIRRTLSISDGELRRVTWPRGSVARRKDGAWVRLSVGERPTLKGGAGTASRPPPPSTKHVPFKPGSLGVVGDESLRDDKRLQAITALIDPAQFELITRPESGLVILQGGAGSGKTTVALHRAAYLYFQNPQVFSPKKMLVVVRSPALTEYISRILPSLGVSGIKVVSLTDFMQSTRKKILPQLKRATVEDVPSEVVRLKKHPALMRAIAEALREEAEAIGEELIAAAEGEGTAVGVAVRNKWKGIASLPLLPRLREMSTWLESGAAARANVTPSLRALSAGILRRARADSAEIFPTWAAVLTDFDRLRSAFDGNPNRNELKADGNAGPEGGVSDDEIRSLIRWVSEQAEEPEEAGDSDDEPEEEKEVTHERKEREDAEEALGARQRHEVFDEELHRRESEDDDRDRGVDGRRIEEDSPAGRFDEHDDALLLRIAQLKFGGLVAPGSQKTLSYEHVVVDEAQDLSPTDIAVLRGVLTKRQSMTIAGDTAQKLVFDNGFDDWSGLLADLSIEGVALEPLRISYRSTQQIVRFSRHVLGRYADPVEPLAPRSGAEVEQFRFGTAGEAIAFIGEALRSLVVREKKASVALITRYGAQADLYYDGLKNAEVPALRRVYGKDFSFAPGVDVVDVAQIKGLEYDYVVLAEATAATYPPAVEARHLLHIAATRAVYQLWVTSVGPPSELLPDHDG